MVLSITALTQKTSPLVAGLLNLLFPPRCVACNADVHAAHSLCPACFTALRLIAPPCCDRCGEPFPYPLAEESQCANCLQNPPAYSAARAAMVYDDASRPLITRLKYSDRHDLAPPLAAQLWRAGAPLCAKASLLVPVPLHPKRLRERKYNQSALLAYGLSQHCGLPVLPDGLLRVRHTPPQASLPREKRLSNVTRAFAANHKHAHRLRGTAIVLIDDVITTGATIHACTQTLLAAGAASVSVLTVARTLKE